MSWDQPISGTMHCNNMPWIRRILLDFLSEPDDEVVDRSRRRCCVVPPYLVQQCLP